MKLLLDESLPKSLGNLLAGHEVRTVVQMGWGGTKNGALLALAAASFEAFITADKNLQYQQNTKDLPVSVVVLAAQSNVISELEPLVPKLLEALATLSPHEFVVVSA